jgi:hypothetical protein
MLDEAPNSWFHDGSRGLKDHPCNGTLGAALGAHWPARYGSPIQAQIADSVSVIAESVAAETGALPEAGAMLCPLIKAVVR